MWMMNYYLNGSFSLTRHHSKMNHLFILLHFLPFAFGGIVEPNALPMKRYDFLEPSTLPMKRYDFLEPSALPMEKHDSSDPSALPMKRYGFSSNITFSNLDWPIEENPDLVCNLVCQCIDKWGINLWICKWRKAEVSCHIVTREIMKNAETIYPETPFLMNVSSMSNFGIGFDGNMGRVLSFEDGFLSDYSQLYAFIARNIPMKKINKHMFEGVERMNFLLKIELCPVLIIEQGSFQNMSSLKNLVLTNLKLSRIEKNMFKDLHSLNDLVLDNNNISKIDANTFIYLHSLDLLSLDDNPISYIHKDAFMGFKGSQLFLQETEHISSSDLDSIQNLSSLWQLFLIGNRIRSVSSDIFKNLPLLYRVYLGFNPISSIPTGIFNHSYNLKEISVGCGWFYTPEDYTNLTLERESFATKSRLNQVLIRGCVTEIKQSAFKGLNAHKLAVTLNPKLKIIKRNFFEGMTDISVLHLSQNGLEIVESDTFYDPSFKKLVTLSLGSNIIKRIEPLTFHNLKNLKILRLTNNSITAITQNVFEGLQSLTALCLASNSISTIDEKAFSSLASLETLVLRDNHITTLSSISFEGLESLSYLDISYNKLGKIYSYDLWYDFNQLDTLLLQGNNILKIHPNWSKSLRLKLLDLSKNNLTDLAFFDDTRSTKIILSQNKLSKIDKALMTNIAVSELLLDHNNISDVAFIPASVNDIDLRYNQIEEVSITEIDFLKKIDSLLIDHNPWKCSCKESDRPLMNFLLKFDIISCCPNNCICHQTEEKLIEINCHSKNKSLLPACLPFQLVKLDYSKNFLTNLNLTSSHKNVTYLDLNQNLVTNIDGSNFTLLRNLTYLDLRSNILKRVPHQLEELKGTKIYLAGNDFICNDCNVINILKIVGQFTPQSFSCEDEETFQKACFICLVKYTIAPYVTLFVGIISLISGLYLFLNKLNMRRLSKRFKHRYVLLCSKKDALAFKRECSILQDLDHINIRKIYKYMITRIPRRVGHFYLEKINCSLREASSGHATLNMPELTRQLMAGLQFLHSRDNPIFIRNLSIDSILLQQDPSANSWILKIGDFSQAIVHVPTLTTDEETPLTTSSDDNDTLMQEDLQAAAHVVYFLLTYQEKEEPITMQDLKEELDIEMSILILSLQNGMTATEALLMAPFHLTERRILNLGELNAIFKGRKKTEAKNLGQAEDNACLVIGGKGAWNKYFHLSLLKEFALLHDGYDITSYVCLLRIIRNILQHGPENPSSMLAVFNTDTPTPEQILQEFSKCFPFFYLHSLYCLNERNLSGSDIYMKTYKAFENYICRDGVSTGAILPLQDKSSVSIHYKEPCEEFQETIFVEGTRSCIYLKDILPQISEKTQNLWPDVSSKELFFKNHEKVILNFSNPIDAASKLCIPEGSSLQVLKPEVRIQLSEQVVVKRFKKNDMVKSLKCFSTKFLPPAMKKKENLKNITLAFDDKELKDVQRILDLDFADNAFVVGILCRVSKLDEKTINFDSDADSRGLTLFDSDPDSDSD